MDEGDDRQTQNEASSGIPVDSVSLVTRCVLLFSHSPSDFFSILLILFFPGYQLNEAHVKYVFYDDVLVLRVRDRI